MAGFLYDLDVSSMSHYCSSLCYTFCTVTMDDCIRYSRNEVSRLSPGPRKDYLETDNEIYATVIYLTKCSDC